MADPIEDMVLGPASMRTMHEVMLKTAAVDLVIPGTAKPMIASLTAGAAADLDAIVERLRRSFKNPGDREFTCQLVVDPETGEVKRIIPVMKDEKFITLHIKTADGFKTFGEYFEGKET